MDAKKNILFNFVSPVFNIIIYYFFDVFIFTRFESRLGMKYDEIKMITRFSIYWNLLLQSYLFQSWTPTSFLLPLCTNVGHFTAKSYRRRDEARGQEIWPWNDGDPVRSREELFHPLYLTHHQTS